MSFTRVNSDIATDRNKLSDSYILSKCGNTHDETNRKSWDTQGSLFFLLVPLWVIINIIHRAKINRRWKDSPGTLSSLCKAETWHHLEKTGLLNGTWWLTRILPPAQDLLYSELMQYNWYLKCKLYKIDKQHGYIVEHREMKPFFLIMTVNGI